MPIAEHDDVGFDEFFTTSTYDVDFRKVAEGFGLEYRRVSTFKGLKDAYDTAQRGDKSVVIEAKVADRNVEVHRDISERAVQVVKDAVSRMKERRSLPYKVVGEGRVVVMLHGFMGGASSFDATTAAMRKDRTYLSVALPGHVSGFDDEQHETLSVESMARAVLDTVEGAVKLQDVEAVVGYSLGGRVGLAVRELMKGRGVGAVRWCGVGSNVVGGGKARALIDPENVEGWVKDWYDKGLWADLSMRRPGVYGSLVLERSRKISRVGVPNLQRVLDDATPLDMKDTVDESDLWVSGSLDEKYNEIGEELRAKAATLRGVGHAVLAEDGKGLAKVLDEWLGEPTSLHESGASEGEGDIRASLVRVERKVLRSKRQQKMAKADVGGRVVWEVELRGEGGGRGVGEVSPLKKLHPETQSAVADALSSLHGRSVAFSPTAALDLRSGGLDAAVSRLVGSESIMPSVRAGLEQALLMLAADAQGFQGVGEAVAKASGSGIVSAVETNRLWCDGDNVEELGLDVVKVKLGGEGGMEADELRKLISKGAVIRGDANRQWQAEEAKDWAAQAVAGGGTFEYIEEPLGEGGIGDLLQWSAGCGLKFGLDETIHDIVSEERWDWNRVEARLFGLVKAGVDYSTCGAVVLKPGLLGYGMR